MSNVNCALRNDLAAEGRGRLRGGDRARPALAIFLGWVGVAMSVMIDRVGSRTLWQAESAHVHIVRQKGGWFYERDVE